MAVGDIFTASVERIVSGGAGMARYDQKPVFMERTAPGDRVAGRIVEDRGSWARAELLECVEASPWRVPPPCPLYGECGGCSLQHLAYAAQLDQKRDILADAFRRIGGFTDLPEIRVVPSPPFEYRNRMQFHRLPRPQAGKPGVGLKKRQSDTILAVPDCPVADPGIRRALAAGGLAPPPALDRFNVYSRSDTFLSEGGNHRGSINLLGKKIILDAASFFQSNAIMLEQLLPDLLAVTQQAEACLPAADLYCGVGTFSIFLADRFPRLDLMEQNKTALALAAENVRGPGIRHFALKDDDWVRNMTRDTKHAGYSFVVLDPPRQGLSPILRRWLAERGPPLLAYVSCDPATLARDARELTAADYRLESLTFYDFYPQTAHVEALAVFGRPL